MNSEMVIHTSQLIRKFSAFGIFLLACNFSFSQALFNENFDGPDGLTSGNSLGVGWSTSCPGCVPGHFETRGNTLEINRSDQAVTFTTDPMSISNCSTLTFSMTYQGEAYSGAGNFETPSEVMGICAGDPYNPNADDCDGFWDFFLAELLFDDGSRQRAEFIGNGNFASGWSTPFTTSCVGNLSSVSIDIRANASATGEQMTFDNIMLVCNPAPTGVVEIDDISGPIYCDGEQLNLLAKLSGAVSFEWYDPDNNLVGNSANLSSVATTSFGISPIIQPYTVIVTDGSGCKESGIWNVLVAEAPAASISTPTLNVCEGEDVVLSEIAGEGTAWTWTGTASGAPGNDDEWTISNIAINEGGTYIVEVQDGSGCSSTDELELVVGSGASDYLTGYTVSTCVDDDQTALTTTFGSVLGNWIDGGPVNNNSFDPDGLAAGNYTITFEPFGDCSPNEQIDVIVADQPQSFAAGPLSQCGAVSVLFDLASLNDTINGNTGNTVEWFADINLTTPIADSHSSPTTTVYAVVNDGGCRSAPQAIELIVSDGPEIMMLDTVFACTEYILPAINIINGSGNEQYYNMPNQQGTRYQPGEVFTLMDTVLYIYDESATCSAEHRFEILIGTARFAGPDKVLDTCATGFLDLDEFIIYPINEGVFIQTNGDTVQDGIIFAEDLAGATAEYKYYVAPDHGCPEAEANYQIFFEPFIPAGKDSTAIICLGQSLDIMTMAEDGGASGEFRLEGVTGLANTNISTDISDSPFIREYQYITGDGINCPIDTAFLLVIANSNDTTFYNNSYCRSFDTIINGTMYNLNNPFEIVIDNTNNGCPLITKINLNFIPENRILIDDILCDGQSLTVNNVVYDLNNMTGSETILGGDINGCDSIIDVNISFDSEVTELINDSYCEGEEIMINGVTFNMTNASGSFDFQTATGCDSVVMVDLSFFAPTMSQATPTLCPDETLTVGSETFDITRSVGTVVLAGGNSNGCDSIVEVEINYDLSFSKNVNDKVCADETYIVNGNAYSKANPMGIETIMNQNACDSVYLIDLQFIENDTIDISGVFCNDTSFVYNNVTYDRGNLAGEEIVLSGSANSCNQYVTINLDFQESQTVDLIETLCFGDSIVVNGTNYNSTNNQGTEVLTNAQGCDSIVNVSLSFEGLIVDFEAVSPFCASNGEGFIVVNILEGLNWVVDVVLDGVSVFEQILVSDTIFNVTFGTHDLEIFDGMGCTFKQDFSLAVMENADFDINSSAQSDGYQLGITFEGDLESIVWSPSETLSCTNCPNPIATPQETTTYEVLFQDSNGCEFSSEITLDFLFIDVYYTPNIFSPNQDGVNDMFYIDSQESVEFSKFEIFDRWGNLVFRYFNGVTGSANEGWDGRYKNSPGKEGVYLYQMTLELANGPQTISGDLTLVR